MLKRAPFQVGKCKTGKDFSPPSNTCGPLKIPHFLNAFLPCKMSVSRKYETKPFPQTYLLKWNHRARDYINRTQSSVQCASQPAILFPKFAWFFPSVTAAVDFRASDVELIIRSEFVFASLAHHGESCSFASALAFLWSLKMKRTWLLNWMR